MSKYKISKEYKILRLLTFPIVKIFLPIAELILGLLVKIPHGKDTYDGQQHYRRTSL